MNRGNIDKIAKSPEDRLLLCRLWDKICAGMDRNVPAATCFLSPREQEMARFLFGQQAGLSFAGGYPDAQRKMLCYCPDYLEEYTPLVCIKATFYKGDSPSHRDFLGALMGAGIARECVGDICMGDGCCLIFVTEEIAPFLLQNFQSAGRTALRLSAAPLNEAEVPRQETAEIRDTVMSLRLDSVVSAGFRIGRSQAAAHILAGKAAIDGLPCEKPDKIVPEGAVITVRGLGKIKLSQVGGRTKKDRLSIIIQKYI